MRGYDLEMAVYLLDVTRKVISKRRHLEGILGYPKEYGDDEALLKRINEFMERDIIKEHLYKFLTKYPKLRID